MTPRACRPRHRRAGALRACPGADRGVDLVVARPPSGGVEVPQVAGDARHVAQREPLGGGHHADGQPAVVAGAGVHALRRVDGVAVADPRGVRAAHLRRQQLLARRHRHRLRHRGFDLLRLAARRLAAPQRDERAAHRREPRDRVGPGHARAIRPRVRVAHHRRQPHRRLDHRPQRHAVLPGTGRAVAVHRRMHDARVQLPQRGEVEAQLGHHARAVVLEHHVAARDQRGEEVAPAGVPQVQRQPRLLRASLLTPPTRFQGRSPGSLSGNRCPSVAIRGSRSR